MNYLIPERLEALAAEYVLGTLSGKARRRFERVMMQSYKARIAVWEWEQQINPLAETIPAQNPPRKIWRAIERRITKTPAKASPLSWIWQGWSAFSAVAILILAIMLTQQSLLQTDPLAPMSADHIALFNDDQAQPLWLITTHTQSGKLVVKPINAQAVAVDNKAFELWMLPKQGAPTSMGLMPVSGGKVETLLSPQILSLLQNNNGLAISLEPLGGSPTGLPTGPVVYQTPIVSF